MVRAQYPLIRRLRLIAMKRRLSVAWTCAGASLLLLLIHGFVPWPPLQWAGFAGTSAALMALWTTVLVWRMPVFSRSTLLALAGTWLVGMGAALAMVWVSFRPGAPFAWRVMVQWLSVSLSLCVGSLLFRALFHRRATPVWGRVLSLVSPMIVVALIALVTWRLGPS
jgi:hypothetical protein